MDKKLCETTNLCVEIMNSKRQAKVKLGQVHVPSAQVQKEQIKTAQKLMDKKLCETTNLCVEIMNSKRQAKVKLGQVHVQIRVSRLT